MTFSSLILNSCKPCCPFTHTYDNEALRLLILPGWHRFHRWKETNRSAAPFIVCSTRVVPYRLTGFSFAPGERQWTRQYFVARGVFEEMSSTATGQTQPQPFLREMRSRLPAPRKVTTFVVLFCFCFSVVLCCCQRGKVMVWFGLRNQKYLRLNILPRQAREGVAKVFRWLKQKREKYAAVNLCSKNEMLHG